MFFITFLHMQLKNALPLLLQSRVLCGIVLEQTMAKLRILQKWLLILFFKIYSFDHAHSKKSVLNLCMLSQQISSSTISLRQKCRCWFPKATAIYFIKKIQHIWGYVCFNKSVMHSINCCIFARFTLVTFNHGSATVASDVIYNSKVILCEYNIKK